MVGVAAARVVVGAKPERLNGREPDFRCTLHVVVAGVADEEGALRFDPAARGVEALDEVAVKEMEERLQTALAQAPPVAASGDADLVVINAKVYTVDTARPTADAFAVKANRFVAVGATADIRGLAGKNTRVVDARRMTVVPGFTDCHNHAGGDVLLYEVLVGNPFEVEFVTVNSIIDKLKKRPLTTGSENDPPWVVSIMLANSWPFF